MALPSKQHAFIEACYELYEQKMFRVALAVLRDEKLAEDAVQDAFLEMVMDEGEAAFAEGVRLGVRLMVEVYRQQ